LLGSLHLVLQCPEHAGGGLRILRRDVAVHHRLGKVDMRAEQVRRARVTEGHPELDRAVAAHRPNAPEHHLGRLELACARALDDDAQQLRGDLGAEAVELPGDDADRVARPAGAAGMALGEAAVGVTDIRTKVRHVRLLYGTFTCRIGVASSATYSGQWPRGKAAIHRGRGVFHCP
jgi:hypothetical protein